MGDSVFSTDDEQSQLFSQSEEALRIRDPYAGDPSFNNEDEMIKYLEEIGQKDVFLTSDNVEIDIADKSQHLSCDCGNCSAGLNHNNQQDYLCCKQLFKWKELLTDDEYGAEIMCVTKCEAYIGSLNSFAVKGEYYYTRI